MENHGLQTVSFYDLQIRVGIKRPENSSAYAQWTQATEQNIGGDRLLSISVIHSSSDLHTGACAVLAE